jgi:hypothetical protein
VKHYDVVIFGNSLASLVAADNLSKAKKVLLINSSSHWGGHFSSVFKNNEIYDPGMILYEFTSFNSKTEELLSAYNPWKRNDAGKFCNFVYKYITKFLSVHNIKSPKMYLDGEVFDDVLISNNLKSFCEQGFVKKAIKDLRLILENPHCNKMHAKNKLIDDSFNDYDFESVSISNHGVAIHTAIIEPFCKKLLNSSANQILALYHRVPWLPLYYPETLLDILNGERDSLPKTEFSYPDNFCASSLTTKVLLQVKKSKNIDLLEKKIVSAIEKTSDRYCLTLNDGDAVHCKQFVWGGEINHLLKISGAYSDEPEYEKTKICLFFLKVPSEVLVMNFTVLNVIDSSFSIYRIFNQSEASGEDGHFTKLVLEFNVDYFSSIYGKVDDESVRKSILDELIKLKVISNSNQVLCDSLTAQLMRPNKHNYDLVVSAHNKVLQLYPEIHLIGPSSGFFSSSLNDQVIQGLKLAYLLN